MPQTKSKTEAEKGSEPKSEPREPRALSTEYHKARKQLMLWSAILFIWELVGIDLEKAKEAGGNAGAIIGALKSPQAVPWALLILVAYFAFKLRIEWGQCNVSRRQIRESRLDYCSAFIVAAAATALYIGQTISHTQVANAIQKSSKFDSVIAGASAGVGIATAIFFGTAWHSKYKRKRWDLLFLALGFLFLMLLSAGLTLYHKSIQWPYALIGFTTGMLLALGSNILGPRTKTFTVSG